MMKGSFVEQISHCVTTGRALWSRDLGFDDWIGSAGEIRFEFCSEFKNSKLSLMIHDRNGNARLMDDCIFINVQYFSMPLVGSTSLQYAEQQ